jgi:hypothetical protein
MTSYVNVRWSYPHSLDDQFPEGDVAVMPTVDHSDIRGLDTALQGSVS